MTALQYPSEPEKSLSGKQRQAALLLASGSTIDNAARVVGCNEKSIDAWKKKPEFAEAVRQAEDTIYNESLALLKKQVKPAIDTLVRNMNPKIAPYVQCQAAGRLLDAALEVHKIQQLEQRIVELEEMVRAQE